MLRFLDRRGGGDWVAARRSNLEDYLVCMVQSVQECRDQITLSPFRFDLRREGGGDVVDFDSSEGREDGLEWY